MHSLIIITHSCIQKTQRPQQTGSRGSSTRSTRSKKLLLKNYTTNTNTDTHTHTHQYTSTSESTLEAQTATKTMSVVDVFSFFIYQPAKIGSTIKVRTARVKCQRPAWPTASLHHSSPPSLSHSRERDTRWTVPVGQFCYRSSECSLLPPPLSLSFVLLPPLPPSLFPPLLVAVVSPFVCLSACRFVCLFAQQQQQQGNGNGNGSN